MPDEWRSWAEDTEPVEPSLETEELGEDSNFPHPLTEARFQQVVQELPTGARLALHTCLSSWRVSCASKFPSKVTESKRLSAERSIYNSRVHIILGMLQGQQQNAW